MTTRDALNRMTNRLRSFLGRDDFEVSRGSHDGRHPCFVVMGERPGVEAVEHLLRWGSERLPGLVVLGIDHGEEDPDLGSCLWFDVKEAA